MAAPIGPGDWVECVGPKGVRSRQRPAIVGGGIYQVDALVPDRHCPACDSFDHPGLHIVGVERHRAGFAGCQFRPIYRPRADFIEALKAPPKRARVAEDA